MRLLPLAIIAATIDVLTIAVIGAATPGHDAVHGYISTLGIVGAPHRAAYIAFGTISAGLHIWWVVKLRARDASTAWAVACAMIAVFFALQWVAAALFPCDPGCKWLTGTGMLHYAVSFAAFVIVHVGIIATTTVAWPMLARGQRRTLATAALSVMSALALLAADRTGLYHGLVERLSIALFGAWTIALSWSLD